LVYFCVQSSVSSHDVAVVQSVCTVDAQSQSDGWLLSLLSW